MLFNECFRLLDTFQQPGNNSPHVPHENLERLGQKIDQKDCLGDDLRPFEVAFLTQNVSHLSHRGICSADTKGILCIWRPYMYPLIMELGYFVRGIMMYRPNNLFGRFFVLTALDFHGGHEESRFRTVGSGLRDVNPRV